MKTPLLSTLLICSLQILISNTYGQSELIPRAAFFTGESRYAFRMDEGGKKLYFKSDQDPNTIFSCPTSDPTRFDSIVYPGKVVKFIPVDNELLTLWKDSIYHISLNNSPIQIPESTRSIKLVSYLNSEGEIALELKSDNKKMAGIYVLDTRSRKLTKKHDSQPVASLFLDDHFNLVAGNGKNGRKGNLLYYFKNNKWRILESHDWNVDALLGGFSKIISVSDDGKTIYYTSNLKTDRSRLFAYNIESEISTELAKDKLVDLLPFGASIDSKGKVSSVVGLYARSIRKVVDESSIGDFKYLDKTITGDISFTQSLDNNQKWLISEFTGGPTKVYLFDRSTKDLTYLLSNYPALNNQTLASRHAFTVKTRDNLNLPVHVYLPAGSDQDHDGIPDQPLPTIMYVHGGPWVGVVHWNQYFHWRNFQLLADRGYAVINCEFRGGTGLGRSFANKSIKTWGTDMTNDKVDIKQWAVESKIAIPEKVGLWGWSYGGYATMAGLAFSPETYACGVSMYGISDLVSFGKTVFADNNFWKKMVGDPSDSIELKMLKQYSPINYVERIKVPLLLTTGSKDLRVPQAQMDDMASLMKSKNKDFVYFYYPEEGHDYKDDDSWISFWAITEQFLKDHLNGKAAPIGNDFELGNKVVVEGGKYVSNIQDPTPNIEVER